MKYCSVDGCNKKHSSKGFCQKHYYRARKWGDPNVVWERKSCGAEGCNRKADLHGYCSKHAYRIKKYGDPFYSERAWREDRSCSIPKCLEEYEAKGYCRYHYNIIRKFKISHDEYVDRVIKYNGLCGICGNKCSHGKRLSLDHDHETGQFRGLLCSSCNLALGGFQDSTRILNNALKYLKEWGKE